MCLKNGVKHNTKKNLTCDSQFRDKFELILTKRRFDQE